MSSVKPQILIIEPFYGGSHKQLIDTLVECLNLTNYELFSLPAKKWHWRARTSALYFSQLIPSDHNYKVLFTSSVLSLSELIGVRPDLIACRKIVYFHENQLVYPVREVKTRDCQYGFNEILSCLAADIVLFNSNFNRTSFLDNVQPFLNVPPDFKLKNIREKIENKCEVLYFPIKFNALTNNRRIVDVKLNADVNLGQDCLHLIWPHRWEHDKNPDLLVEVLLELSNRQANFKVTICGESYQEVPKAFEGIREKLGSKLINYGHLSREEYIKSLLAGDIVISTASHEFYGVSMLEATYCGCYPIAPNRLVYPEIYPKQNLYSTKKSLIKMLYNWCRSPEHFRRHRVQFFESFTFEKYSAEHLVSKYLDKMGISVVDFD
ncbi:glycosyltransferase-like domain-containing protein 1-like [Drosophila guanche]|uniref:tRNA-queuosine alpha-mannosyltransferase n=1 Tax=Drosophila guanche TaxID=7266 RepID=A0A3B0KRE5_DROGU|nr:glycosyltransferase-like domain-containing protein 1-like [Drosophila guanche]SPP86488.1 blast:Glycosyltransferase-like domain-containing protein 1-like [Drosophila guanche]